MKNMVNKFKWLYMKGVKRMKKRNSVILTKNQQ